MTRIPGEILVTPEMALKWLAMNTKNRPIIPALVDKYSADMRAGRWLNDGTPIQISISGRLNNGQHRLISICRTGIACWMNIQEGCPEDCFITLDNNKPRTGGHMYGAMKVKNYNQTAAIARLALCFAAGTQINLSVSNAVLAQMLALHPDLEATAAAAMTVRKIIQPGPLGAVIALGNSSGDFTGEVEQFLTGLRTGENLAYGDPRLTLRGWLFARSREVGALQAGPTFFVAGRAWSAFAQGRSLSAFRDIRPPTIRTLTIFGFDPAAYPIPDLGKDPRQTAQEAALRDGTDDRYYSAAR